MPSRDELLYDAVKLRESVKNGVLTPERLNDQGRLLLSLGQGQVKWNDLNDDGLKALGYVPTFDERASAAARAAGGYLKDVVVGAPVERAREGLRLFREAPPGESVLGRAGRYGWGALNLLQVPFAPQMKVGGDVGEAIGSVSGPAVSAVDRLARMLTPHMDPFAPITPEAATQAAQEAGRVLGATAGGAVSPLAIPRAARGLFRGRPPAVPATPAPDISGMVPPESSPWRTTLPAVPAKRPMPRPSTKALPEAPREARVRGFEEPPVILPGRGMPAGPETPVILPRPEPSPLPTQAEVAAKRAGVDITEPPTRPITILDQEGRPIEVPNPRTLDRPGYEGGVMVPTAPKRLGPGPEPVPTAAEIAAQRAGIQARPAATRETPSSPTLRPPAPATFLGWQPNARGEPVEALYNLTSPVAGRPVGDTVSATTLRELGYEPPLPPAPPRFEATQFGQQGVIEQTPGRAMPSTALRAAGAQQEIGTAPLFQPPSDIKQLLLTQPPPVASGRFYGKDVTPGTVSLRDPEEVRLLIRDAGGLQAQGLDLQAPPELIARQGGTPYDVLVDRIAKAQSRPAREVERELADTLRRFGTKRGELAESGLLAEIRGAQPPSDIPLELREWQDMQPSDRQAAIEFFRAEREFYAGGEGGEAGRIRAGVAARLGSTAAGAALGGTQGETSQERLRNAVLGGAAGAMSPTLLRLLRAAGEQGGLRFGRTPGGGEPPINRPPVVPQEFRQEVIGPVPRIEPPRLDPRGVSHGGGPVSPADGRPIFDPAVSSTQPLYLSYWDRIKALIRQQKERLPAELPLRNARPGSPLITSVERHSALVTDDLDQLLRQPWTKALHRYAPSEWVDMEWRAVQAWKAGGKTEEAYQAAVGQLPDDVQAMLRHRRQQLFSDLAARRALGLEEFDEVQGPYFPRLVKEEAEQLRGHPRTNVRDDLRQTVGSFQRSRTFETMQEGIAHGVEYHDPADAWLLREWASIKMQRTASLMRELEVRGGIFRTEPAARAASPTGEAWAISGLPGAQPTWWTATRPERQFLIDNLSETTRGGPFGNAVMWANTLFRGPNLINPAPHILKNMTWKYIQAGGNPARLPGDVIEFFRETRPDLLARFRDVMPFSRSSRTATELLSEQLRRSPATTARRFISKLNRFSSNIVFTKADPAMRYSLWKHYVARGLSDQEASNETWIDLVRYGTRSQAVDFWKSLPGNFFTPWRVGTITSLLKAARAHPVRTAFFIAAADALREMAYRHLGRWFHAPIDYTEGPVAKLISNPTPGNITAVVGTTLVFGPGGAFSARQLGELLKAVEGHPDWEQLRNIFWGLAQVYGAGQEMVQWMRDRKPERLWNVLTAAALGEHYALTHQPNRLGQFVPATVPGFEKSSMVRRAEELQQARSERIERRRGRQRRPTIEELVRGEAR